MMAIIPTLKTSTLSKIALEIWQRHDLNTPLLEYAFESVRPNQDKEALKNVYYSHIEPCITQILALPLPESLISRVGLAFIRLEKNLTGWAEELMQILQKPTRENLTYCMVKTIHNQFGDVEKSRSLFKVMFDSYLRVKFKSGMASDFFCIQRRVLSRFLRTQPYIRNKVLIEKVKFFIMSVNVHQHWGWKLQIPRTIRGMDDIKKTEFLLETAVKAPIPIWDVIWRRQKKSRNPKMLCLVLAHMFYNREDPDKIIYIYENIDKDVWKLVLKHMWPNILSTIYMTEYSDYCVKFYNQICHELSIDSSSSTLHVMLLKMATYKTPYRSKEIYYLKAKEVFLKLWMKTPSEAKKRLHKELYDITSCILRQSDYGFLSVILNDSAFSAEQQKENVAFLILDSIEDGNLENVDKFLNILPNFTIDTLKENSKRYVKRYLVKNDHSFDYDALMNYAFGSKELIDEFKREAFSDREFVVDVFATVAYAKLEDIVDFLTWAFNDLDEAKQFVQKHLLNDLWLLDIIKTYLLNVESEPPNSVLFNYLVENETTRSEIKRKLREDKEFMFKCLDRSLNNSISDITFLLPCLFDESEINEKARLVHNYVFSKKGIKYIYCMLVKVKDLNRSLYYEYELELNIKKYFKFRKHWLLPFNLCNKMSKVISMRVLEEVKSYKKTKLLPHESKEHYDHILRVNYRIFTLAMNPATERDTLLRRLRKRYVFDTTL